MEYKGYNIKPGGGPNGYIIHSIGSGALPKTLRGQYTSYGVAQRQIDLHVDLKAPSKVKPVKE